MLPASLHDALLNNVFDFPALATPHIIAHTSRNLMRTDIRECETTYEMDMDLPGFAKDEITMEVSDGCLTIAAKKAEATSANENGQQEGAAQAPKTRWLHKERYTTSCQRRFQIPEALKAQDITASFTNGVLHISIPRQAPAADPKNCRVTIL